MARGNRRSDGEVRGLGQLDGYVAIGRRVQDRNPLDVTVSRIGWLLNRNQPLRLRRLYPSPVNSAYCALVQEITRSELWPCRVALLGLTFDDQDGIP